LISFTPIESAFNPEHPYYDEKSNRENPKWEVVHVEFRRKFDQILTLETLKSHALPGQPLENLQTLRQSRVSVSRVTPQEWDFIMNLIDEVETDAKAAEEAVDAEMKDAAVVETEVVNQPTSEPVPESEAAPVADSAPAPEPTQTATNEPPVNDASLSEDKQEENGTKSEEAQVNGEKPNENGINGQTTAERFTSVFTGSFLSS